MKNSGQKRRPKSEGDFCQQWNKKANYGDKKKTQISNKNIGLMKELILYINHELILENQKLYKLARDLKRQNNYKYNSRFIHVDDIYSLDELLNRSLSSPKNLN